MNEETKQLIKNLNKELLVLTNSIPKTRERSLAITKIQEAIMWLESEYK